MTQANSSSTIVCVGFAPIGGGSVLRRHVGQFIVGVNTYENSATASTPDALRLAVPTLEIQLNRAGTKVEWESEPFWWYPKKTYVTTADAYKAIPHTWVCRTRVPKGERVPFDLEEPAFRRALIHALAVAVEQLDNGDGCVNPVFLQALVQGYRP